jgi:hypothetical protein
MNKKLISAFLVFGIMGFSNFTLAEERDLTGGEVTAMFSDKTVWGENAKKKTISYFAADGSFNGKNLDNNKASKGKWSVDKEGQLCLDRKGKNKCRKVVDDGGLIKKYKGSKHVFTYTKFEEGNKL